MSDINDRLNGDDIEISRRDVKDRVTDIIYTNSEVADGEVLQYNSTTGLFSSVSPNAAGLYVEGGTDLPVTDGGTGASTASGARANLGIGTIATQNANAVAITGGTISGLTTLGASAAAITGGTITGITDLAVADGGTGASTLTGVLIGNGTSAITAENPLTVAKGGTGVASNTAYGVLCGGTTGTGAIQSVSPGTANYVLVSNGAAALPSFQDVSANAGSLVKISSQTASNSSTIDFTGLSSTYPLYIVELINIVPSTDDVTLNCRIGTGGTPTYPSTNEYNYINAAVHTASTEVNAGASAAAQMLITPTGSATTNLGSSTGENLSGFVRINNPSQSSYYHTLDWIWGSYSSGAVAASGLGSGVYLATTAVTAIRFLMSSGNIASGTFILYGVKNA